jgi:hypothetical protein
MMLDSTVSCPTAPTVITTRPSPLMGVGGAGIKLFVYRQWLTGQHRFIDLG